MDNGSQAGGHEIPRQESEPQKCFVAHSYEAEWHDTIEAVCNEILPEYGLQPWYANCNYDPTTTLRDKIVSMIDSAPYGVYDLSYWREDERSPWVMPRNVLIELGIAIALNRPTILLRHTGNRIAGIALPKSIQGVTQKICEFTGGDYSLEAVLRKYLSDQAHLSTNCDWHYHRCRFGEIDCSYLQVYPHTAMIGHNKLHCHIADGPDTDQPDFRHAVETVLGKFNNISYSYLDKGSVSSGYTFLLCTHCQLVRSTPFAIYRITPDTSPDTYIAIGISIGLEYRFRYKIPHFMITKDMQYVPSLLHGYEFVVMKNLYALKTRLPQFVQQILTKMDEPSYWRPKELPFETRVLPQSGAVYGDMVGETPEAEREKKHISVFICYAREDEKFCTLFLIDLELLRLEGVDLVLHRELITSVKNNKIPINYHFNEAHIVLLLVSPDFIVSDFYYSVEMKKAIERAESGDVRIIPIILWPVDWRHTPFSHFQALPRDGTAVNEWSNRERAFTEITEEIGKVAKDLGKNLSNHRVLANRTRKIKPYLSFEE